MFYNFLHLYSSTFYSHCQKVQHFFNNASYAQSISGTVTDDQGEPVIGASVVEKGKPQNGAITDFDGKFTIKVSTGTPIIISYVGYVTQELKAANGMKVTMKEDAQTLQDVVVIGYGVQKKSVVTAAIAKVSAEDLDGKTRLRAEDALKGLAAGVNVTSSSGQPGAKSMIRIRGIGTINNSEPLYIIDGMPTDQNGMESVNPGDIESIEVLKDAASVVLVPPTVLSSLPRRRVRWARPLSTTTSLMAGRAHGRNAT